MKRIRYLGTLLFTFFALFASIGLGAELRERQLLIQNLAKVDAYCAYAYVVDEATADFTGESVGYHVKGWVRVLSGRSERIQYNSKFMPFIYFILENNLETFEEDKRQYPPSVHYVPTRLLNAIRDKKKPSEDKFEIVQGLKTGAIVSVSGADKSDLKQVTFYNRKKVLIPGPVEIIKIVEPQTSNDRIDTPGTQEFDSAYDKRGFIRQSKDHAILFATNTYQHWRDLDTPIRDAEAIAVELLLKYGFTVDLQRDVTLRDISKTLAEYAEKSYRPGDQLLVYFAGHGVFHETLNEGYIAGTDSVSPDTPGYQHSYLSHSELKSNLDKLGCERVLLVLDVSYGGTFGGNKVYAMTENASAKAAAAASDSQEPLDIAETLKLKTRWYLSAVGKEIVHDGFGEHSPFAASLLTVLKNGAGKDGVLTIPEIEHQLPPKLQAELDKAEAAWREKYPLWDVKMQQTPASGPFGSGKKSDKAFVFIKSQK